MILPQHIFSRKNILKTDILTPPDHIYKGTLGRMEYEALAQVIVEASQAIGAWAGVSHEILEKAYAEIKGDSKPENAVRLREFARVELSDMVKRGILHQSNDSYSLTDRAIELIAEKYSVRS